MERLGQSAIRSIHQKETKQMEAKLTKQELARYNRHIIMPEIGMEGQMEIKRSKVLVIGAGGLGCPVLQYLGAAGIGYIGIVDGDQVDISNLQRQILFAESDIGKSKAEVAKQKLKAQNSLVHVHAYTTQFTPANAEAIVANYDIVVDCTDNFPTRYLINDTCVRLNKPLVFASIYKFEGQLSVFNYNNGPTYRCLYPSPPEEGDSPNCSEIGVLGVLPGLLGTLQANEVLKIILKKGDVASGRLMVFNALSLETTTFQFELDQRNKVIDQLEVIPFQCRPTNKLVSVESFKKMIRESAQYQLIDVRQTTEYNQHNIGGISIPLNELKNRTAQLETTIPVVIVCQSGVRSLRAVEELMGLGFHNCISLEGGINGFTDNA